ncbi:MAG: hypothetical protein AB7S36_07175 [Planctomycetota bacterium]
MRSHSALLALAALASLAAFPALLLSAVHTAAAQSFPINGTLDDMEKEADRIIADNKAAAMAAEAEKKKAEENEKRWGEFEKFVSNKVREIQRGTSSREHRDLMNDLNSKKSWYVMGLIYHNLGAFRDAEKYFKASSSRTGGEAPTWASSSLVMLARLEMIDVFEDKDPSRWEGRIDRDMEKTRGRLTDGLDKLQVSLKDAQDRTGLGDMNEYFGNLKDWLHREVALKAQIQKNTWDTDAMWSLIRLYRDNLDMLHLARAWAELYRQTFLMNSRTLSCEVDAEIARLMVAQGFSEDAQARLQPGDDIQSAIESIEGKVKEIEKKAAEANQKGEPLILSDEEKELSKLDPTKLKNDARKNSEDAKRDARRVQDFVDGAAGRRREGGEGRRDGRPDGRPDRRDDGKHDAGKK